MHRLFVAIDLPDHIKDALQPLLSGISGVKWVKRNQLHLTLQFIGEVDTEQFNLIGNGLSSAQTEPFEMRLNGVGRFRSKGAPHVLWVGVEENSSLRLLHRRIEDTLAELGYKPEDRKFSGHITLARLKESPPRAIVDAYLAKHRTFQTEAIPVNEFILFSSVLSSQGPTYRAERRYELSK